MEAALRGSLRHDPESALQLAHFVERVVITVPDRSHRGPHAGLATPLAEHQRRVLTPLIRVMDDRPRLPLPHGHIERREHEGRPQRRFHRPADDAATPGIEHDGQGEEAAPRRDVGDIRHPQLIRAGRREHPLHQIWRRARAGLAARRDNVLTATDPTRRLVNSPSSGQGLVNAGGAGAVEAGGLSEWVTARMAGACVVPER